ncbi:Flp1 family type IVb pilin [Fusibacter sp. 3D3]|uniref:Flp1 family type IVb pilin n=1 Tax=Fusibacter sp. 3D3 TaxID=1048380 RepID=UPI0008539B38|nr:Flp1 family type IVb pilin [Fusibacter sp. 3D3]GAU78996.1 hypothetical protein F3D3_3632 [Fusibacter sp. 3D3]
MLLSQIMPLLPKRVYCGIKSMKLREESGLGTIEMVILIAVLIALGFTFKDFIVKLFEKITGMINKTKYEDLISN